MGVFNCKQLQNCYLRRGAGQPDAGDGHKSAWSRTIAVVALSQLSRSPSSSCIPRCDSHRNSVWLTRLTRASNRSDSLARSIRSNLPQCFTAGAMRRIDLACRLTETVAELVSSRFAFKATGPAPQLQLLFSRSPGTLSPKWQPYSTRS